MWKKKCKKQKAEDNIEPLKSVSHIETVEDTKKSKIKAQKKRLVILLLKIAL